MRRAAAALLAALLLSSLVACGSDQPEAELTADVLEPPFQVPDTRLTDTEGRPFRLASDTDARLTLLFYGYTNCPDICGIVMGSLASAVAKLDERERQQIEVLFITSDPARDTGPVLREYLDRFDPSFVGLTGDLGDIADTGKAMGIYIERGEQLESGGYDPGVHGTKILGIDPADEVPVMWDETTSAGQFAADIHTLLGDA